MPAGAPGDEASLVLGASTILNAENNNNQKDSSSQAAAVLHADESSARLQGPASEAKDAVDQAKCQDPASITSEVDVTADRNAARKLHRSVKPRGLKTSATSEKRIATSVERVAISRSSAL